jgi:ATP-dependent Clp protease ATP-binding subunit ClpB
MSDDIHTEHLLVGLAADGGPAATGAAESWLSLDELLAAFEKVRGSARVTTPIRRASPGARRTVDLTATPAMQARSGHRGTPRSGGHPGVSRAPKTNPVRSASLGVIKLARAQRIVAGDAPTLRGSDRPRPQACARLYAKAAVRSAPGGPQEIAE